MGRREVTEKIEIEVVEESISIGALGVQGEQITLHLGGTEPDDARVKTCSITALDQATDGGFSLVNTNFYTNARVQATPAELLKFFEQAGLPTPPVKQPSAYRKLAENLRDFVKQL